MEKAKGEKVLWIITSQTNKKKIDAYRLYPFQSNCRIPQSITRYCARKVFFAYILLNYLKMDAYKEYLILLNSWIRSLGRVLGYDILNANFKITFHTQIINLSMLCLLNSYIWTIYHFSGVSKLKAVGLLAITSQVRFYW